MTWSDVVNHKQFFHWRITDNQIYQYLRNYNKNENAGAEAKPGGVIMVIQCKKGKLFVTGEVFFLDIGLLRGALSCALL